MELGPGGEDLAPHSHTVAGDARITVPVARWREPIPCQPTLTGNVHRHAQVGAGTATPVPPRDVIVYLPPGYDADAPRRYPVLYMHDGNNLMDSCTAFAGEWGADETAEEFVTAGQIEPLIFVGVYNTSDRVAEYTPVADPQYGGGRADDYGRYLVEVVKPLVDSTYRTRPEPQYTGVAGSSLGGLVSMHFGLTRSSTFSRIGVLSPSVWWANREIVTRVNALAVRTPVRIWEDIGTAEVSDPGGAAQTVADARALRDALLAKGWVLDADLKYLEVQGAMHNESAWRARFGDVLKFLYPP
jgi:predicted alpha/beta superfamily hydrolase